MKRIVQQQTRRAIRHQVELWNLAMLTSQRKTMKLYSYYTSLAQYSNKVHLKQYSYRNRNK